MNESILNTIKKMLGMDAEYTAFDTDIIVHINSCFMKLNQLGVGPKEPFRITGPSETWSSFFGDKTGLESVKDYIYIDVRLIFDPPASSFVVEAMKEMKKEYEWRLMAECETSDDVSESESGGSERLNYNDLENLPSINGVTLRGNYNETDPKSPHEEMSPSDLKKYWDRQFN